MTHPKYILVTGRTGITPVLFSYSKCCLISSDEGSSIESLVVHLFTHSTDIFEHSVVSVLALGMQGKIEHSLCSDEAYGLMG